MRCPHCGVGMRFETAEEFPMIYEYEKPAKKGLGVELVHGFCPECEEIIVLLKEGKYKKPAGGGEEITEPVTMQIIYPKVALSRPLASEIPENYRRDFQEASAVLALSPKASAAISRRLLQHILLDEYKLKKGSLDKQIEEFIHLGHIPSHISEAVDAVRNVGNFAAHPLKDTNTGEIVEVEPGEAEWLLEVIDALFDFTFVQPKKLKERRDKLNQKLTAIGKPKLKT